MSGSGSGDDLVAFATIEDVAARKGRPLTAGEETSAAFLLPVATANIAEAASKDDAWAEELDPVPTILRGLTVELVCRAMANPDTLAATQEQLGSYQYSASFRRDLEGLRLTETEVLIVRRVVYGRITGSPKARSVVDELIDPDSEE